MSLIRRNPKRDANEKAIVDALRDVGATVERLSGKGVPDLLVGFRGRTVLLEVKRQKRGRLTRDQRDWCWKWNGEAPVVVRNENEALAEVCALRLTANP